MIHRTRRRDALTHSYFFPLCTRPWLPTRVEHTTYIPAILYFSSFLVQSENDAHSHQILPLEGLKFLNSVHLLVDIEGLINWWYARIPFFDSDPRTSCAMTNEIRCQNLLGLMSTFLLLAYWNRQRQKSSIIFWEPSTQGKVDIFTRSIVFVRSCGGGQWRSQRKGESITLRSHRQYAKISSFDATRQSNTVQSTR
jgi:hypothetical protein